jgi:hypothetical protein
MNTKQEYTKDYFYNLLSFSNKSYIYKTVKDYVIITLETQMGNEFAGLVCTNHPDNYKVDKPFKVFTTKELIERINQ